MQYQSPNISSISSPSTSFISPRASPMLAEQIDPLSSHTSNNPSTPYDFQSQQASLPHQQHPQSQEQTPHKNSNADGGAPPKQVALAMERLGQAGKLVAQTRICSDRFVEALYKAYADKSPDPSSPKFMQVLASEDLKMRGYLDELRSLGRTLEASGVMIGALQKLQETPGWGLHMPLVCPDGAVVAYAWKRQLAGQAAASAVDRTRLALKAFTDQKRRFFPHLEKDDGMPPAKRSCLSFGTKEDFRDGQSKAEQPADLLNVIKKMERETPTMKISAYSRLEWFTKISPQPPSRCNASLQKSPKLETHSEENSAVFRDVGVLDISVPSVLRAVISLTPAGSAIPDAVAFFSSEEVGSHMYARGSSKHNVFTQVSKFADKALQYFLHVNPHSALENLLRWIYTYQSLFTKACSKCGQIVAMDRISAVLLPPVIRPYQQSNSQRTVLTQPTPVIKHQSMDEGLAFHLGCSSEDET